VRRSAAEQDDGHRDEYAHQALAGDEPAGHGRHRGVGQPAAPNQLRGQGAQEEGQRVDFQQRVEAQQADIVFAPRGVGASDWMRCTLYRERLRYVPPGGSRGGPTRITLAEIARDRLLLPQRVCGLAEATRKLFQDARLEIDEYPGRAISYGALEDWAELGLGGAILPESKVRATDPLPIVMAGNEPALLTYDAMWPKQLLTNHVRGFARKLPGLARALFPSTQGVWAPGGIPTRFARASGRR
jgi:DNA-binding transcriptional LysR family regulator